MPLEIKAYTKNAKKQFICKNCKIVWDDYLSNDHNKQFCSIECKSRFARINKECQNCHKIFTICRSVLKTNATGRYCSRPCYVQKITTGLTKNKGGFRTLIKKLFPNRQFCAICGTTKGIQIHHIEAYKYTQNNDKKNLIPLCRSHHKIVEIQTENLLSITVNSKITWLIMRNILRQRQSETGYFIGLCKLKI